MAFATGLKRLHLALLVVTGLWAVGFLVAALTESDGDEWALYLLVGLGPLLLYLVLAWIVSGFLRNDEKRNAIESPAAIEVTQDNILSAGLAARWPRYWARILDLTLEAFCIFAVVGFVAPEWVAQAAIFKPPYEPLLGFAVIPFALVLDAAIVSIFGNSLGKWIAGIKVVMLTGEKPTFLTTLQRNFGLYWWGLGLAIPIVSLFTLISSSSQLQKGNLLAWDSVNGTRAYRTRDSLARTWATVGVLMLAYVAVFAIQAANSPERQLEKAAAQIRAQSPQMVDAGTRLDGAISGPGMRLTYNYTLVSISERTHELPEVRKAIAGEVSSNVTKGTCESGDMRSLLATGVTLVFSYSDIDGAGLGSVTVRNSDCL